MARAIDTQRLVPVLIGCATAGCITLSARLGLPPPGPLRTSRRSGNARPGGRGPLLATLQTEMSLTPSQGGEANGNEFNAIPGR